jgi:hypothetical protein
MKSQKVYYYEVFRETDSEVKNHFTPVLTTDENKAKLHQDYRLATYDDLIIDVCAYGTWFPGVVEVQEGTYIWHNNLENDDCDYIMIA